MAGRMTDRKAELALRDFALGLPGAYEEFPWGERVVKAGKKVFVFMSVDEGEGGVSLSVKMPQTGGLALALPFAEPTGYGLGGSGWVTASFARGEPVPVDMLVQWIEESYRAVAPKKLVSLLGDEPGARRRPRRPKRPGRQ